MTSLDLTALAKAAEAAADRARREILPRFRSVPTETKSDGSPVTEADRAAERAIRETLREACPDFSILGEEFGEEAPAAGGEPQERDDRPAWIVDPIDGTLGFSRGVPLFATLIALVADGEPVLGLIDLPTVDERYVGWKGGGCRRNGEPVHASRQSDLSQAIVSHGDPFCFDLCGERAAWERMAREIPVLRGYSDAFGHGQALGGGIDVMVDLHLNRWDAAATQVLMPEAGGACRTFEYPEQGKLGLVLGSPPLVEALSDFLSARPVAG